MLSMHLSYDLPTGSVTEWRNLRADIQLHFGIPCDKPVA